MSYLIDIADAVVETLNAAALSQAFTAVRYYVPVKALPALDALAVSVVPITLERSLQTRGATSLTTYGVDIGIQQRLPSGPMSPDEIAAACDPLMDLAEEVAQFFYGKPLAGLGACYCTDVKNLPVFSYEHLDEKRVFTSLLTLSFKAGQP
jgi:hypothetical protein